MGTRILEDSKGMVMEIIPSDSVKQMAQFPASNIADIQTDYEGPSPYHLNYCGYESCTPGFRFGPFVRHSYLLHMITAGRGTYEVGGKTYSLSKGDMFLIYPGDVTSYQADQEDPWTYYWIGFGGYQASYILSQMGYSPLSHTIRLSNMDPLMDCVLQMLNAHRLSLANELARESLLLRFFSLVLLQLPDLKKGPLHARSAYAKVTLQYLTDNYMNKIRISDIARTIGVDRSYLTRSFQAEYQMSPQEYLMKLRMQKAQELLKGTDQSIAQIASQCGYSDALAFTKIFRQYYYCSPTEFRK